MREFRINTGAALAAIALLGLFQQAANAQVQPTPAVIGSVVEPIGSLGGNSSLPADGHGHEPIRAYNAQQYLVPDKPAPTRYVSSGGSLRGDVRSNYQDGVAFGFQKGRLYHPLEGPKLNLQGRPTVDTNFGQCDTCDEWAGICGGKDLDYDCGENCGGLKANPGHLGLPWLRSKDNCDVTVPVFGRNKCKGCDECSSCGGE